VRNCQTPILVLPDDVPGHPYAVAMETVHLAPNAQVSLYPWKGHSRQDSAGSAPHIAPFSAPIDLLQQRHLWPPLPSSARYFVPGLRRGLARWPSGLSSGNDGNAASPAVRSGREERS
jgi:hypothetical protein